MSCCPLGVRGRGSSLRDLWVVLLLLALPLTKRKSRLRGCCQRWRLGLVSSEPAPGAGPAAEDELFFRLQVAVGGEAGHRPVG